MRVHRHGNPAALAWRDFRSTTVLSADRRDQSLPGDQRGRVQRVEFADPLGDLANRRVGRHSGRHAILTRLGELGIGLPATRHDAFAKAFAELAGRCATVSDRDLVTLASSVGQS